MSVQVGTPIVKINDRAIRAALNKALVATADTMQAKTVADETMPYRTGATQEGTKVTKPRKGEVKIQTNTHYSIFIYFKQMGFNTRINRNAGPYWWEEYVNGSQNDFIRDVFIEELEL